MSNPDVTVWKGVTEAADEPARGPWFDAVVGDGLAWDNAVLKVVAEQSPATSMSATWTGETMRFLMRRTRGAALAGKTAQPPPSP